jgi:hypothetical protein
MSRIVKRDTLLVSPDELETARRELQDEMNAEMEQRVAVDHIRQNDPGALQEHHLVARGRREHLQLPPTWCGLIFDPIFH